MQDHQQHAHFRKFIAGPVRACLFILPIWLSLGAKSGYQGISVRSPRALIVLTWSIQYSFTNIKRMEPLIDARVSHWIGRVGELFADSGEEFDFAPWAM